MDDSAQAANTNNLPTDATPQVQPQTGTVPLSPISPPQKEQQPVVSASPQEELIKPSETEPVVYPELSEIGVEKVSEAPKLSVEDQTAGLSLASESTPVVTKPTGAVQLPMTEREAKQVLKMHKKIADSIVWMATLIIKHFKRIHETLVSQ